MGMRARSESLNLLQEPAEGDGDSDEDEFHDCLSWGETDLEVGVDVGAMGAASTDKSDECCCGKSDDLSEKTPYSTNTLPKMFKDTDNRRTKVLNRQFPPHKTAPDGTTVHYWCEVPTRRASFCGSNHGMSWYKAFT